MKRPRPAVGRAVAACATVAALLAGCGVQETDVIEVGGPATLLAPDYKGQVLLFFVVGEGEEEHLTTVVRQVAADGVPPDDAEPVAGPKRISALFAGPQADERAAGLRTELPELKGRVEVETNSGTVTIDLPLAVRRLGKMAVRQVVCTAAYVEGGDGGAPVIIKGDDETLPPARC
ncbi:hypothetical protein ACFOZ0_07410 [Streptomyces yaanensis]|uniref:Lipoprotein n=1 Tax=Streptomyces yaanensis TaxID=1142239 RepID=A0ABV7S8E4_9ACTN|nr:hypothetical protein [Streptomyces sp. CGMCC 4.7035]WNC02612.1 hypothetical protein Q2K21_33680 [Streptomyces sp. CGMCC 4.7035]